MVHSIITAVGVITVIDIFILIYIYKMIMMTVLLIK